MNPAVAGMIRAGSRGDWMDARTERDFIAAESIGSSLLARHPDDEPVRRYTARLLDAEGRTEEADHHWTALRDRDPGDFEAAFHVARAIADGGGSNEAAAAAAASAVNDVFRGAIVDALRDRATPLTGEFRHVAICGVSYCGSTLLDRLLGGLPAVKSIGESHWITKVRRDDRYCDMDLSEPLTTARFVPCTVCGAHCQVLTPAFRRSLAADNHDWYRKVAARLNTRILVSADKGLPKLSDKDPLLELSALIVFKSPEQAWRSQLDKLPAGRGADYYDAECRAYLDTWAKRYESFVHHFRPAGPLAFLNFDAFTRTPEPLLRAVCSRLDLPFDAAVLLRTVPGHAIGGNGRAMRRLRDKDYGVDIAPLPDAGLAAQHQETIAHQAAAQAVWREMMTLHDDLARQG
jgi:hypothetical protein